MFIKKVKDNLFKLFYSNNFIPRELYELSDYFRYNDPIYFDIKKEEGLFIAISKNFRYGSIITEANNSKELNDKIKDAILTSFEIPSSYEKEANIKNIKENSEYAFA